MVTRTTDADSTETEFDDDELVVHKKKRPAKPAWEYGSLDDDEEIVNILYYGDGGAGKTTDLAFLAKLGKVVYIEAESGLKKGPLTRLGVPIKNLQLVRDTADTKQITFGKLAALCDRLRIELADNPKAVAGVVWDSVTEIQKKFLRQVMDNRIVKFQARGVEVETHKNVIEDYGICTEQMRDLIRMYRDLPCHVGFAGLEVRDEDDDGAVAYRPNLTPKLASDLIGYVDLVCHTTDVRIGGDRFYLGSFRRGGKFQAKDRFGILPEILSNPTYDRVIAYVNGTLTEKTDDVQKEWLAARKAAREKS